MTNFKTTSLKYIEEECWAFNRNELLNISLLFEEDGFRIPGSLTQ